MEDSVIPPRWWSSYDDAAPCATIDGLTAAQAAINRCEAEKLAWVGARAAQVHAGWEARQSEQGPLAARFTTSYDELVAEVGAALSVGASAAGAAIDLAEALRERCPRTFDLLHEGRIALSVARTVVHRCELVTDADRLAEFDARVVERIESKLARGSVVLTVPEVKKLADGVLAKLDPEAIPVPDPANRLGVWCDSRPDGLAELTAVLHPEEGVTLAGSVDRVAESVCKSDPRKLGERRAAALIALTQGYETLGCECDDETCERRPRRTRLAALAPRTAVDVIVVINESTLAGMDDAPALLDGDVVPAGRARDVLSRSDTRFRHAGTLSADGKVHARNVSGYRPSAALAEMITTIYPTCVFPGCTVTSSRCQLDHVRERNHNDPSAGGGTEMGNLLPLCGRHHRIKTEQDWLLAIAAYGGVLWESPTGHLYRSGSVRGTDTLPDLDRIEWRSPLRALKPRSDLTGHTATPAEERSEHREKRRQANIRRRRIAEADDSGGPESTEPPDPPVPPPF